MISGNGSEAQKPNCCGLREIRSAAKSLHCLVSFPAAAVSLRIRKVPGELMDRMDFVMFRLAMRERWVSSLHSCEGQLMGEKVLERVVTNW